MTTSIRLLDLDDLAAFQRLRRRALTEHPHAFLATLEDDRALSASAGESFADPEHRALFGAGDADLVGCVGVVRAPRGKSAHRATIWGMYVTPEMRRHGLGEQLLNAAIACARAWGSSHVTLAVSESAAPARRLDERSGFVTWGREPDAMRVGDRLLAEDHMVLRLRGRLRA